MGMQLFGGQFNNWEEEKPRANFDTFPTAFLTVFQILTMENWQFILYTTMSESGWIAAIYLISWIFIGNFVLLNLFLAILLDSFIEEDEEEKKEMQEKNQMSGLAGPENEEINKRAELNDKKDEELLQAIQYQINFEMGHDEDNKDGKKFVKKNKNKKKENNLLNESIEITPETLVSQVTEIKPTKALFEGVECERSFFFIPKSNPIRVLIYKMIELREFEFFILVLIIMSSIKLIGDTYILDKAADSPIVVASNILDMFFIVFFALESLIKAIAIGFVLDKGSYLRESWSQLDFFIVVTSIIDLSFDGINLPVIKILRLLRTLRPLRFISHNSGMRIVVEALIQSVGHIFNVAIVVLVVWLMFAILGVNLFGGKFQYCDYGPYEIETKEECDAVHSEWHTYDSNFDSVPQAMLTLFVVSSLEGWPDIMYQGIDATDVEKGPSKNASILYSLYFVGFILIGSFFFLNFFVGVIFLNFEEAQKEEKEALVLNDKQLKWIDIMRMILNSNPDIQTTYIPKNKIRRKLHTFVNSNLFEYFIMTCIVLNMFQMAIDYEGSSVTYNKALTYINYIFTAIFTIECCLKLGASGKNYFSSNWNNFDFFVVFSSIVEIVLSSLASQSVEILRIGPQLARVLRILRVTRLLRLINKLP